MTLLPKLAIALLLALLPLRLSAETPPVVVELFTSQGCSSCPPADALMEELAKRPDVIALALHVDYWDYIGWADTFAQAKFTERQKGYAHTGGRRMIYTPQMVVNGQQDVVGAKAMALADLIARHKAAPKLATVRANRSEDAVRIEIVPTSSTLVGPLDVFLVRFTPKSEVAISHGENAGRTITYANTVREWTQIGRWGGAETGEISAPITDTRPAVVIVQRPDYGAIVAATRVLPQ